MPPRPAIALVVLAVLLGACGDGKPDAGPTAPPAAEPAPELPPGPPEATVDDEFVVDAVFAAARAGAPLPESLRSLPPRVSPVRVAVRSIHDHLLGVRGEPPTWEQVLAALDDLAKGDRTKVDAGALGPLVAAWRAWTPQDRDVEHVLAVRYTRGLDLVRSPAALDAPALAVAAVRDLPKPPAKSPAWAGVVALQALHAIHTVPGDEVPKTVLDPLGAARAAFAELGWPGGLGPFLEIAGARLSRSGKATMRQHAVHDAAFSAYRESGDALRAALVTYDRVGDAEREGDVRRAAALAGQAVEQIAASGSRGRELSDALFRHAQHALAAGKPRDAVASLDRALAEIESSKADPAQRAPLQERRATALWFLGRFDDAVLAAEDGAKAYDARVKSPDPDQERLRASLDEVAGRAMLDGDRAAEAATKFLAAADRHARLPAGDAAAATDRLFAADALAKCGQRDGAALLVHQTMERPGTGTPVLRAHAASVYRDMGAHAEAERELSAALAQASEGLREVLLEESARLQAAKRDFAGARQTFAVAAKRSLRTSPGFPAGRLHLDWARMERDAGDLAEAARLADVAIGELATTPFVVELDRARKLWIDLQRRRSFARDAMRVAGDRVASGPPGTAASRSDAAVDLVLATMEVAASDPAVRPDLEKAVAAIGSEIERDALGTVALGRPWTRTGAIEVSSRRSLALVHAADRAGAATASLLDYARALPVDEPELRRWALRRVLDRPEAERAAVDWVEWLDLWLGTGATKADDLRAALGPEGRFAAFQWTGTKTVAVRATSAGVAVSVESGDAGFRAAWDATYVDAGSAASVQKALAATTAGTLGTFAALGSGPVVLCVGPPLGPVPEELTRAHGGGNGALAVATHGDVLANSPAEFVRASRLAPPDTIPWAARPTAPLGARHEIVEIVAVDEATRGRFRSFLDEARRGGLAPGAAIAEAKRRLREEWKPASERPEFPAWMSFALRGAP